MEDTYKGQVDNPLTLNRYTYTHNNPLRYWDPSGNAVEIGGPSGYGKNPINPWVNGFLLGYPEQVQKVIDTEPFTAENLAANAELFFSLIPAAKFEQEGAVLLSKGGNEVINIFKGKSSVSSYEGQFFYYSQEPLKKGGKSISDQITERGWNDKRIGEALNDPAGIVNWVDQRKGKNNAPVTAYYHKDGGYVVRSNETGEIIQVSQVGDLNWSTYWPQDAIKWNK
ncbi:MAG TPA: colicin E5-related ribonuclease [Chondromyces sp.]|nr:colicin E5-related ribonuclease [Chondromyces sp.]